MKGCNEMHLSHESMKEIVQAWLNKTYTVYNATDRRPIACTAVMFDQKSCMFIVRVQDVTPAKDRKS
jgi:hypothetical protein